MVAGKSTSILLPLDGSANSLSALAPAQRIAQALDLTLHIIHVSNDRLARHELLSRLGLPPTGVSGAIIDLLPGEAAKRIIEAAEQDVALIVMSTHGVTGFDDRLLGEVAEEVLDNSNVDVILIPPRCGAVEAFDNIIIPLDGMPSSAEAVPSALRMARGSGATIWALHVPLPKTERDTLEPGAISFENLLDQPEEFRRIRDEFLERFVSRYKEPGEDFDVRLEISTGYPPQEILRAADRVDADLIVVGWHGDMSMGRAQVLKNLVHQAACPVMVTRVKVHDHCSRLLLAA